MLSHKRVVLSKITAVLEESMNCTELDRKGIAKEPVLHDFPSSKCPGSHEPSIHIKTIMKKELMAINI